MQRSTESGARTDAELVQRVKLTNDPEAFEELYKRYHSRILLLCNSILRDAPGNNAEDVLQDAFLAAYCKIDSFRGEAEFSTWLYRIAVNIALTRRKKMIKRDEISIDELIVASLEKSIPLPRQLGRQEVALERFPEHKLLREALERLSPDHKMMIYLRDFLGFSYKEISAVVKHDPRYCQGRHSQAMKKLKRLLGMPVE
jgi:RNA polymerase sigma-70 factor (ECF subfamily)